ncbi:pseudaminic acid cytidylyltransferase [Altererythrobacter litoralis]|uniref:Pseudaminic acid cytidylyltransferase n=1 Tax=Altererythrobacter litoralis TaxID=3113904 RepID=A0ABU7GFW9_9SPHN|nr:pseudaminic acid cytidylyltransferase [Erythrobacteraceae bacterium 1XM1-14]
MRLAIIPARGGSKRIARKNIRDFCGRPIIAWSITAAKESKCFDHVVVSTDDDEIADIARQEGAEVPFRRPSELADDLTPTIPVIAQGIEACEAHYGEAAKEVCCLYATAPFVRPTDLKVGFDLLELGKYRYVFPITTYPFPIQRALRRKDSGHVAMFSPENFSKRSQDLEEAWHDAGQFYWGTAQSWREGHPIFRGSVFGIPLPRHRVQDIDTPEDWARAELLFNALSFFKEKSHGSLQD